MCCVTLGGLLTVCVAVTVVMASNPGGLQLYVNRMWLDNVNDQTEKHFKSINYLYADGDAVHVRCVGWSKSNLPGVQSMNYSFSEEPGGYGMLASNTTNMQAHGLRITLRAAHNGSRLTCKYFNSAGKYSIQLNFVAAQAAYDGLLTLKTNNTYFRYWQPSRKISDGYMVTYAYQSNERLTWEFGTEYKDIIVVAFKNNENVTAMKINVGPTESPRLIYEAHDQSNWKLLRRVKITFSKHLYEYLYDNTSLTLNITNSLLELQEYHYAQYIYYPYHEHETLVLNCSTLATVMFTQQYYLAFDRTVESHSASVIQRLQLSAAYDNRKVGCFLLRHSDNSTVRHIQIFFRMKQTTSPSPITNDKQWIITAASIVTCVVVCVCVTVCVRRQRPRRGPEPGDFGRENTEEQLCDNEPTIAPYPTQWESQYSAPICQRYDGSTYSEVIPRGDRPVHNATAASTSKNNVETSEVVYAVLDLASSRRAPKRFHSEEESPYAEVCVSSTPKCST